MLNVFPEEEQKIVLDEYNIGKKKHEVIPIVPRNFDTGWPLLQVSFYSPTTTESGALAYEAALGGGKCHFFHMGAFSLATLLTKIPGSLEIKGSREKIEKNEVTAENIRLFLDKYCITHREIGIGISSVLEGYGKKLTITSPVGDAENLGSALSESFQFALNGRKSSEAISDFDSWSFQEKPPLYLPEEIKDAIDENVAAFFNGQILIDFGYFLDYEVEDREIKEYFQNIFKVDEFRALKTKYPDFKPTLATQGEFPLISAIEIKAHVERLKDEIKTKTDEISDLQKSQKWKSAEKGQKELRDLKFSLQHYEKQLSNVSEPQSVVQNENLSPKM